MSNKKSSKGEPDDINSLIESLQGAESVLSADQVGELEKIPTGIHELDEILGGGFAKGRIVDIYGNPGGGKSAVALKFAAEAQKHGKVLFIDLENSFDITKAVSSGIDTSELLIADPESAEETFELVRDFSKIGGCSAIIIDSMAGLSPEAEIAGDVGDSHVGLVGRIVSQSMRLLRADLKKTGTILVGINQVRDNIGSVGYGPSTTPTGGKAFKFYSSTRLNVARIESIKAGETNVIGQVVQVKTDKSRLSPPFQKAKFDLYYEFGISREAQTLEKALSLGVVQKNGAWFTDTTTGEKLGQGKLNAIRALIDNPETLDALLQELDN